MRTQTTISKLSVFLAAALLTTACSEAFAPADTGNKPFQWTPAFAGVANGFSAIALDRETGTIGDTLGTRHGRILVKGFNVGNPQHGDAIIATFYWLGSRDIIDSVRDVVTTAPTYTPVGNTYHRVEYIQAGGYSMATYVATNVQNYPYPENPANQGGDIYAVAAYLSDTASDGGVSLSAWTGVADDFVAALGEHHAATGSGAGGFAPVPAHAAPIQVNAGAVVHTATMSGPFLLEANGPPGYRAIGVGSDDFMKQGTAYVVQASAGPTDPTWTWFWPSPDTWLVTTFALNPPPHLAFTVQPKTTPPLMAIPAVQVTALDAGGNRVTSFNGSVTIAIGHNGGTFLPGTLSGTKTVTAVNGVATFSNLSIDQLGNGYTLVVSAANVFGAESAPFNIGLF